MRTVIKLPTSASASLSRQRAGAWRAFSLIEVLVSAVLLIVGLAAALSSYNTIATQLNHATRRSTAGVLAEAMLEDLILRFPGDPALTLGAHDATAERRAFDVDGISVNDDGHAFYLVTWEVRPYAKVTSIREVEVHVRWTDLLGTQSLELKTWRG